MITKKEIFDKEFQRENNKTKKFKNPKKLNDRIRDALRKLNNKNCYEFFDDSTQKSYHNLLDFLTLVEIKCEKFHGKKKKYKKAEVEEALQDVFYNASDKECDVLKNINKLLKNTDDEELLGFKFKKLLKGKESFPSQRFPDME